jgi:hypothetical protein
MGQSTDAIVFYGYCWHGEDQDFTADMDEVAETILKQRGRTDPWSSHPGGHAPEWVADNSTAIDAWHDAKEAVKAGFGVDWGTHCSDGCPMPYLYIPETEITARRGYPEPLTSLKVDLAWKPKLDAFLQAQGIEPPEGENQPGWWTASYWG